MRGIKKIFSVLGHGPYTVNTAERDDNGKWKASPIPLARFDSIESAIMWMNEEAEYMSDGEWQHVAICDNRPAIIGVYEMGDVVW